MPQHDTIILGAGAAGMMCAIHAAGKGGRVLLLDHAKAPGEKIRISGGGRCNFTNLHASPANFLSNNRHFAKSALSRYTQADFIALVRAHNIPFHEKTLGQLFCDTSARGIITMLLAEMARSGVDLRLNTSISSVRKTDALFTVETSAGPFTCRNLVIATGGKSIPKMGATDVGYRIADQFDLNLIDTRAGLVPLTFGEDHMAAFKPLAGVALDARVSCGKTDFNEAILFTHRGLSGPAILQISSYWREKLPITIDLTPHTDLFAALRERRSREGRKSVSTVLADHLPKRLASHVAEAQGLPGNIGDLNDKSLRALSDAISAWTLTPTGSEGYRTAEVTLGGVDTKGLDSTTMEAKSVPGLHFIGEVVDVTGWLGGYNFQWAWSSGWAAGRAIADKPG